MRCPPLTYSELDVAFREGATEDMKKCLSCTALTHMGRHGSLPPAAAISEAKNKQ
jgi:hypothetical protein